jgi:peptidoglycan/LPS O-acetylase OafA/YrhL
LISKIIIEAIKSNQFTFGGFLLRRMRRLMPASLAMVSITTLVSLFMLTPTELVQYSKSVVSTLAFYVNHHLYSTAGYFGPKVENLPLLHMWSLAVEEQFYLVYPLLLALFHKKKITRQFILLAFFGSLVENIVAIETSPDAAFYWMPMRIWELFLGCSLALFEFPKIKSKVNGEAIASVGLLLILGTVFSEDGRGSKIFSLLAAVFGTAMILYSTSQKDSFVKRILTIKPLVFLGVISYSLYLWHWPLWVFYKQYNILVPDLVASSILFVVSLVISYLSWRFIESPFRKVKLDNRNFVIGIGLIIGAIASVSLYVHSKSGLNIVKKLTQDQIKQNAVVADIRATYFDNLDVKTIGKSGIDHSIVVLGDSNVPVFKKSMGDSLEKAGLSAKMFWTPGCRPLLEVGRLDSIGLQRKCTKTISDALEALEKPEVKTIILVSRWVVAADGGPFKNEFSALLKYGLVDNKLSLPMSNKAAFNQGLDALLKKISILNKQIIILGPIPEIGINVLKQFERKANMLPTRYQDVSPSIQEFLKRQKTVLDTFSQLDNNQNIHVIYPHKYLCGEIKCLTKSDNKPLYFDDNHLSKYGAQMLSGLFTHAFKNLN